MGRGPAHHPHFWSQTWRGQAVVWSLEPGPFPWLLLLHSWPPCPTGQGQQPPLAMGTTGRNLISCLQKSAPPAGPLSKASNSYIVAWGQPPYLLPPILCEVDGYHLVVHVFQGQS